jgi:hypothetical protein
VLPALGNSSLGPNWIANCCLKRDVVSGDLSLLQLLTGRWSSFPFKAPVVFRSVSEFEEPL